MEEKSHSGTGGGHRGSDVWAVVQQDLLPEKVFSYNRQEEGAKLDFFLIKNTGKKMLKKNDCYSRPTYCV